MIVQVVREASKRVLGLRPFDVQLIGGMILHNGEIAEMRTGEGKTLVAVLPAYLNALAGKGVQVSLFQASQGTHMGPKFLVCLHAKFSASSKGMFHAYGFELHSSTAHHSDPCKELAPLLRHGMLPVCSAEKHL